MYNKAKRVVLPVFSLTETCELESAGSLKRRLPNNKSGYYYRPVSAECNVPFNVNNMEMVLNPDGSPWPDACLYLLSRMEDNYDSRHVIASSNTASDLTAFRTFIFDNGNEIDYLHFPRNKLQRPTYRYRGHLKNLIRTGELAKSTAQRLMQTVIGFYRWLTRERGFSPDHSMWNESDRYINFNDSVGFSVTKTVKTTDVSIKGKKAPQPYEKYIMDGGKLKPLQMEEQITLVKSLFTLGNMEMILIHLLGIYTGARIQTVLTLKVRHFRLELPDGLKEVRLGCGPNTGIDTKNDKELTLFIPRWLHDQINIYTYSDNAQKRRVKSNKGDSEDAYLFLSNRGAPYYEDSIDRNTFNPKQTTITRPSAGAIRTFIADHLLPLMKITHGVGFTFHFHDLRATFGMNLSDSFNFSIENGEITLTQARNKIKELMAHDSFRTTDKYLQYRERIKIIKLTQEGYQNHLKSLSDAVMTGLKG